MRVLHTSDWHLGRSFHGVDILDHQRSFIEWLVELVRDRDVEVVVIAGDIYDRSVPSLAAIDLWEDALLRLSALCPVVVTSGNHDSAIRLGFASKLLAASQVHLRTRIADIADPVSVTGRDGVELLVYGVPYLEPDLHRAELEAERSHQAVLTAAMDRVRADLAQRPGGRSLVVAHAFITGSGESAVSESERDLRVGGIGDAPASVFTGVDYVALGHLHGPQSVTTAGPLVRYSGSPLAFSFSEEAHEKSVTLLEIPATGPVAAETVPAPVPRPLVTLTGTLDELLDDPATRDYAGHWVRVRLTDPRRPENPMGLLKEVLPHTVDLTFDRPAPNAVEAVDEHGVALTDPLSIAEAFVQHVTQTAPTSIELELLRESVERVRISEVSR